MVGWGCWPRAKVTRRRASSRCRAEGRGEVVSHGRTDSRCRWSDGPSRELKGAGARIALVPRELGARLRPGSAAPPAPLDSRGGWNLRRGGEGGSYRGVPTAWDPGEKGPVRLARGTGRGSGD